MAYKWMGKQRMKAEKCICRVNDIHLKEEFINGMDNDPITNRNSRQL